MVFIKMNKRFKIDENVPLKVVKEFELHGFDVATVYDENLQGCNDGEIMGRSWHESLALLTSACRAH